MRFPCSADENIFKSKNKLHVILHVPYYSKPFKPGEEIFKLVPHLLYNVILLN